MEIKDIVQEIHKLNEKSNQNNFEILKPDFEKEYRKIQSIIIQISYFLMQIHIDKSTYDRNIEIINQLIYNQLRHKE